MRFRFEGIYHRLVALALTDSMSAVEDAAEADDIYMPEKQDADSVTFYALVTIDSMGCVVKPLKRHNYLITERGD